MSTHARRRLTYHVHHPIPSYQIGYILYRQFWFWQLSTHASETTILLGHNERFSVRTMEDAG
jgi:hypothetical protein